MQTKAIHMHTYGLAMTGFEAPAAAQIKKTLHDLDAEALYWHASDENSADLVLVGADSTWGHMSWLKLTGAGRLAVACSASVAEAPRSLPLPAQADALARLLRNVRSELGEQPRVTHHAAPLLAEAVSDAARPVRPAEAGFPAAQPSATSAPAPTIADMIADAMPATALLIEHQGMRLLIDPQSDRWYGESALKPLAGLLARPSAEARTPTADELTGAQRIVGQPLARLRWFVAYTRNAGLLPRGANLDSRLHLARWPVIEREFPRHFRIATAMMRQPATLATIASQVGVAPDEVANFARACQALGVLEVLPPAA